MISLSSNRLVVFSKSADAGQVKTRMRPFLSEEECLSLHIALLQDTLQTVKDLNPVLYLSGSGFLPFQTDLPVRFQTGQDLGQKLFYAFQQELQESSGVIVIGSDSPCVSTQTISKAFALLKDFEGVFGPTDDGGYYLIGLQKLIPEIFQGIAWGGQDVLKQTTQRMGSHSYALLEGNFDIDTPQDLVRLEQMLQDFPSLTHLIEWMRKHSES